MKSVLWVMEVRRQFYVNTRAYGMFLALAVLSFSNYARANTVVFTWSAIDSANSNYPLKGQVTFGITNVGSNGQCLSGGCELTIDMINTSTVATNANQELLDGLYFNIKEGTIGPTGGTTPGPLTMASASAVDGLIDATGKTVQAGTVGANICAPGGGSEVVTPSCSTTQTGGWQAAYDKAGIGGGSNAAEEWGIGTNVQGGIFKSGSVNTFNYSVVPSLGVGSQPKNFPYVFDQANFVFTGLTSSSIFVYDVEAVYGNKPNWFPTAVLVSGEAPEPGTAATLVTGGLLLLLLKRRRV